MIDTKRLVKERDAAFTEFVRTGNPEKVYAYCIKYGVKIPKNKLALAGGIYKAVQHCTDIPEDVKLLAAKKCREIGMNPYKM